MAKKIAFALFDGFMKSCNRHTSLCRVCKGPWHQTEYCPGRRFANDKLFDENTRKYHFHLVQEQKDSEFLKIADDLAVVEAAYCEQMGEVGVARY